MSSEIALLEAEIKEYKLQLETVQLGLQSDPDNAELLELKSELDQVIALSQSAIADLAPSPAPPKAQPKAASAAAAEPEKWKRENHPKFRDTAPVPPAEEESRDEKPNFKVNDTVLAKWHSGDKGFYPARITSITGSSVNPVYIVKFKNYDTVETLRGRDVKAVSTATKRKVDGTPVASFGTGAGEPRENPSGVISAEANIDKEAQIKREREASKVGDGPVRPERAPKKIKANKELEKGKSKWQDWSAKGMGKKGVSTVKKESMFRTPEGMHGRVGFTGSGQTMRKDPTRSRHIYQTNGDDEGLQ